MVEMGDLAQQLAEKFNTTAQEDSGSSSDSSTLATVSRLIAKISGVDAEELKPETALSSLPAPTGDSFGCLERIELTVRVETELELRLDPDDLSDATTIADVVKHVENVAAAKRE